MVGAFHAPAATASLPEVLSTFGVQLPRVHKPAPDFSLPRLRGGRLRLQDMRGKVVLMHFWATWCAPCRHEMPQIESLWRRHRASGLMVLGVNVDRGNPNGVRDFIHERDVTFPVLLDPKGEVRNRYEVRALPTSYIIGRDGKIIGRIIGERDWSGDAALQLFQSLLTNNKQGGDDEEK